MSYYDYKVVPAPQRVKKVRGVTGAADLFALTLTDAINEVARQGWEYVRAETMVAEAPRGFLRKAAASEQTMLVFRRPREHLSPRLAAAPEETPLEDAPRTEPAALHKEPSATLSRRPIEDRVLGAARRREPPVLPEPDADRPAPASPLRPSPRLGPAGQD
jgi:hypothetical protein